jgi:hypothetical protein
MIRLPSSAYVQNDATWRIAERFSLGECLERFLAKAEALPSKPYPGAGSQPRSEW